MKYSTQRTQYLEVLLQVCSLSSETGSPVCSLNGWKLELPGRCLRPHHAKGVVQVVCAPSLLPRVP